MRGTVSVMSITLSAVFFLQVLSTSGTLLSIHLTNLSKLRTRTKAFIIKPSSSSSRHKILESISRGGSDTTRHEDEMEESQLLEPLSEKREVGESVKLPEQQQTQPSPSISPPQPIQSTRKVRHTSDLIHNLMDHHTALDEDSQHLRALITERSQEFVQDLAAATDRHHHANKNDDNNNNSNSNSKLPDPLKVLHYLAPKIPAIKQSPEFLLRIETAKGDMDSGVAAGLIAVMARLSVLYAKEEEAMTSTNVFNNVIKDRRFEQLVECVLCGVDVRYRKKQAERMEQVGEDYAMQTRDIEDVLDGEDIKIDEGLTEKDACRAAWGLGVLLGGGGGGGGGRQPQEFKSFGGQEAIDILTALSLRTRERLLARLNMLRQGELITDDSTGMTLKERFDKDAEDLAEDAVKSMWAFACVKAFTGIRFVPLFETCCSILCQNPTELRKRASEQKSGLDDSNFEIDDVVERLALAEDSPIDTDEEKDSSEAQVEPVTELETSAERDALLDWLSSTETVDIMWALALHGSTEESVSKQELTLSETAAALKEIAFDRIESLLRHDIASAVGTNLSKKPSSSLAEEVEKPSTEFINDDKGMIVEVVDAAALLSMEKSLEENEIAKASVDGVGNVEEIRVVDAATLLSASGDDDRESLETEIIVSTSMSSMPLEPEIAASSKSPEILHTSQRDLCSIAWAVTELSDSLRPAIIDLITEIFACKGVSSLQGLQGRDLTNLAWALAKRSNDENFSSLEDKHLESVLNLVQWIGERSWSILSEESGSQTVNALDCFQAPELGRVLWSLAVCLKNLSPRVRAVQATNEAFVSFARVSLEAAVNQTQLFATEDLARVTWGFLELCDLEEELKGLGVVTSLGRLMSVMEGSLLKWESGQSEKIRPKNTIQVDNSNPFASFLGRSRLSLRFLEQRLGSVGEDDEESPVVHSSHKSLPLLRDLSMDPATICKLACGFSLVEQGQIGLSGAWTFTRVAVRLLTSKNNQLLRESATDDIVRLLYACAANDRPGCDREYITRLFARKLVQYFNELLETTDEPLSDRLRLSGSEASTLVWAMGGLGVRQTKSDQNRTTAFKRLRLVTGFPLVSLNATKTMSPAELLKLLRGITSMNAISTHSSILESMVDSFQSKIEESMEEHLFVDMVESAGAAYITLKDSRVSARPLRAESSNSSTLDEAEMNVTASSSNSTGVQSTIESENIEETISAFSRLLMAFADYAAKNVAALRASDIRRVLSAYYSIHFEVESLFACAEKEVRIRLEQLAQNRGISTVAERVAEVNADTSKNGNEKAKSPLLTIQNKLLSVFANDEATKDDNSKGDESLEKVERLLNEVSSINGDLETFRSSTKGDVGLILAEEQRASAYELGRCLDLIARYRRYDFERWESGDRCDTNGRKSMQQRTLSRMFV